MKLIIARSTVQLLNSVVNTELSSSINESFGPSGQKMCISDDSFDAAIDMAKVITKDMKNIGLVETNGQLVLSLDDEVIFKYMMMYVNIAKSILPLVKPLMAVFTLSRAMAKTAKEEITNFLFEPIGVEEEQVEVETAKVEVEVQAELDDEPVVKSKPKTGKKPTRKQRELATADVADE